MDHKLAPFIMYLLFLFSASLFLEEAPKRLCRNTGGDKGYSLWSTVCQITFVCLWLLMKWLESWLEHLKARLQSWQRCRLIVWYVITWSVAVPRDGLENSGHLNKIEYLKTLFAQIYLLLPFVRGWKLNWSVAVPRDGLEKSGHLNKNEYLRTLFA